MTPTELQRIRDLLPARAAAQMDLANVRRKNELRDLLDAHLSGSRIQIVRLGGAPSAYGVGAYDVILAAPHLIYTCFGPEQPHMRIIEDLKKDALDLRSLKTERLLPVRIELPETPPDRANPPRVKLLDHRVFHPSVLGPFACWADRWKPTTFIVEILTEIAALLSFERVADLQSPLNPQAAKWMADGHPGFELPLR